MSYYMVLTSDDYTSLEDSRERYLHGLTFFPRQMRFNYVVNDQMNFLPMVKNYFIMIEYNDALNMTEILKKESFL